MIYNINSIAVATGYVVILFGALLLTVIIVLYIIDNIISVTLKKFRLYKIFVDYIFDRKLFIEFKKNNYEKRRED